MRHVILGKTDERTTCERCGKQDLKATVVLKESDTGNVVYYGADCAAQVLKGNKKPGTAKVIMHQAGAIGMAATMLANGMAPKTVALRIWDRYGYAAEGRGDVVMIQIERESFKWWTNAIVDKHGNVEYKTMHVASYA